VRRRPAEGDPQQVLDDFYRVLEVMLSSKEKEEGKDLVPAKK
jgi:hypothetical protein